MKIGAAMRALSFGGGGGGGFSPNASGWWIDYSGAPPWSPTPSAGSSGSNGNLITSASDPSAGAALNGHGSADFGGSNILVSPNDITTFCATTGGAYIALVKQRSAAAPSGTPYADPCVLMDTNEDLLMTYTTSGYTAVAYDGAYRSVTTACGTGAYHAIFAWWDGTDLHLQIDSGADSNVACGNLAVMTGALVTGRNGPSAGIDALVQELATMSVAPTPTEISDWISYFNTRYGLSL